MRRLESREANWLVRCYRAIRARSGARSVIQTKASAGPPSFLMAETQVPPHSFPLSQGPSPASVEKSKRVSQFEGMLSPDARSLLLREESPPEFGGPQSPGRLSQEEVTLYWRIRPWKERDHLCTCPTDDPLQGNCESRRGKGRGRWAKKGPLQWVNQCGSSGLGGTQIPSLVHSWAIQSLSESLLSAYSGPGGRLGRQR